MKKREMNLYLIGTVIVTILSFALSILYSHLFVPDEYGVYALVYNVYTLIAIVFAGWLEGSIIRKASFYREQNKIKSFWGNIVKIHLILSLGYVIISIIVILFIPMAKLAKGIMGILCVIYFFEHGNNLVGYYFRYEGLPSYYNVTTVCRSAGKFVFVLLIIFCSGKHSIIILPIAMLITEIAIFAMWFWKLKLHLLWSIRLDFSIIRELLIFGLPLIVTTLSSWVLNTSDRFIIKLLFSDYEVGVYTYAYQMGNSIASVFSQFIMLGAYPAIVKAWEVDGKSAAEQTLAYYLRLFLVFNVPLVTGVFLVGNEFFDVFIGQQYQDGIFAFKFTCLAVAILGLNAYPNKAWELRNKTKNLMVLTAITAVINILLNFFFMPIGGYSVAAITTAVSFALYFIIAFLRARKCIRISVSLRNIANIVFADIVMALVIVLSKRVVCYSSIPIFLFGVIVAAGVYFLTLYLLGEFSNE